MKTMDEIMIGDMILCEPITRKGRGSLYRLNLDTKDMTRDYFYDNLCIESKYGIDKTYENEEVFLYDSNSSYYNYTVNYEQFVDVKNRLKRFDERFLSNSQNEYPLLMLGVAGNGKSIEINRRLRSVTKGEGAFECSRAYFDLENSFFKKTYGVTYICPDSSSAQWLFCIKILDGLMQYIKNCSSICDTIYDNFKNIIMHHNIVNAEQRAVFENIRKYKKDDNDTETEVFKSILKNLKSVDANADIQALFEILMILMFCSNPGEKHYIVIDNIEQYIKLNSAKIQIPNSDIALIYKSINAVVANMVSEFDRIQQDLAWKVFKIIIVLRRTSIALLDSTFLHAPAQIELNSNDVTGHFQVSEIWKKKKNYLWDNKLMNIYNSDEDKQKIDILEKIMNDNYLATGLNYQSMIAPLMCYGIRRNARTQAHAAYKTYEVLSSPNAETIKYNEFEKLLDAVSSENNAIRYMFRRALIEFQFKWAISNTNSNRWNNLGLGYLENKKKKHVYQYKGKQIQIEKVYYDNTLPVSLMRRVLSYLSSKSNSECNINSNFKSIANVFVTISLYDLIKGVLIPPQGRDLIQDDDYLKLARVLLALSDMSNTDTRSAPYIVIGINDNVFHNNPVPEVLSSILKNIWEAGAQESSQGGKYSFADFGVRITDAGLSFVHDWQASFSFMAALHCYTVPPLFFLNDIISIKYVIESVYNASLNLCTKYEEEATQFCGSDDNVTLERGMYILKQNDRPITIRQHIKKLHSTHLDLYRNYVENNYLLLGMSEEDMIELTDHDNGFISRHIDLYMDWDSKGNTKCF